MNEPARDELFSTSCYVCGQENPLGLKLKLRREGELSICETTLPAHVAGYEGVAHGGVVAALLDEAMAWAVRGADGLFGATADLRVRFRKPVLTETPLRIEGRRISRRGPLCEAESRILNGDGVTLAEGKGKFMLMSKEQTQRVNEDVTKARKKYT